MVVTSFSPAPVRARWHGWTPQKQIDFVEALSETACVAEACRLVGMSAVSAYALRWRPCARHFRAAWDAALDMGVHRLEQVALGRALNGVARPVFYQGEQVGEWREYDERLTMFLLRYRRPARFGAQLDHGPAAPAEHEPEDEAAARLDWHCDEISELQPSLFEDADDESGDDDRAIDLDPQDGEKAPVTPPPPTPEPPTTPEPPPASKSPHPKRRKHC
ncbi:MAG: hypothetical protein ABIW18_04230 [Sphingomicrobium sp.]